MSHRQVVVLVLTSLVWGGTASALDRTVTVAKPTQLEAEIRAIPGFPQKGIQVYSNNAGGALVHLDDTLAPLTAGQVTKLDTVITNHVPDFSQDLKVATAVAELNTNQLNLLDLSQIDAQIDALIDGAATVADLKVALKTFLKRVARYEIARRQAGQ